MDGFLENRYLLGVLQIRVTRLSFDFGQATSERMQRATAVLGQERHIGAGIVSAAQ